MFHVLGHDCPFGVPVNIPWLGFFLAACRLQHLPYERYILWQFDICWVLGVFRCLYNSFSAAVNVGPTVLYRALSLIHI